VRFVSGLYADPVWFDDFPTTVFTRLDMGA
ncbi:unnamed protein product, partial [marine sediment metagenome]